MPVVSALAKVKSAALWVVSYWKWFLFPLGVLFWFAGKASGKTTVKVASPELVEHFELQEKLAKETDARVEVAKETKAVEVAAINQTYEQATKKLDAEEAKTAKTLQSDPDALNDFLKGVGRDVRSKPRV